MSEEQKKFTDSIEGEVQVKKSKKKHWIIGALGLVLIIMGSLSMFQTEEMNNLAVQIGSKTVATEMTEAYPEHTEIWAKAITVLDAAIEARTVSPDKLSLLLNEEITKVTGNETPEVVEIINKLVEQFNIAWKSSDSEEVYIEKLKALSAGIKQAL